MRRQLLWLSVLILMLAGLGAAQGTAADVAKIDSTVKEATALLPAPDREGPDTGGGVLRLVDALALAAPLSGFPAPFAELVGQAHSAFSTSGIMAEAGLSALHKAYKLAKGTAFAFDPSIKSIPDAVKYCSARLQQVRAALGQGRIGESAADLLDVLLTIMTPMKA